MPARHIWGTDECSVLQTYKVSIEKKNAPIVLIIRFFAVVDVCALITWNYVPESSDFVLHNWHPYIFRGAEAYRPHSDRFVEKMVYSRFDARRVDPFVVFWNGERIGTSTIFPGSRAEQGEG